MKITFEGTQEQMHNLQAALDQVNNSLPKEVPNFEVLSVYDVQQLYYCSEKDAEAILAKMMNNEGVQDSFRDSLSVLADMEEKKYVQKTGRYEVVYEGHTVCVVQKQLINVVAMVTKDFIFYNRDTTVTPELIKIAEEIREDYPVIKEFVVLNSNNAIVGSIMTAKHNLEAQLKKLLTGEYGLVPNIHLDDFDFGMGYLDEKSLRVKCSEDGDDLDTTITISPTTVY